MILQLTNERVLEIVEILERSLNKAKIKNSLCYHLLHEEIDKSEVEKFKSIITNVFIKHSGLFGPQCLTETVRACLQMGKNNSISANIYIFVHGENGYKARLYLLRLIKDYYSKNQQLKIDHGNHE